MKNYLWLVAIIFFIISVIGVILPALISAKSDEAVVLGAVIISVVPVVLFYLFKQLGKKK